MPLSDSWLRSHHNKAVPKAYERTDRDSLSVRVSPKGKITFQYRFRWKGKAARMDIGVYPLIGLKEARAECEKRRAQLFQGNDPRLQKKMELHNQSSAATNEEVIRDWYEKYCSIRKKDHKGILRSFEIHVFPKLGEIPVDQTTTHMWLSILEPLADTKPSIADRILGNTKQAHKWAYRRQMIENQPLALLNSGSDLNITKRTGGRALNDHEINIAWKALDRTRMAQKAKLHVKLCLCYGCRPIELREAHIDEFDFDSGIWTIPPHRHKTGAKTGRPLKRPIIPVFEEMIRECIYLSMSNTLLFTNDTNDKVMNDRATLSYCESIIKVAQRRLGIALNHFSLYDLRKTARTHWATLTEPHIAEIMLGHKLPGEWQTYDHHYYIEEQKEAYEKWWARIQEILAMPL